MRDTETHTQGELHTHTLTQTSTHTQNEQAAVWAAGAGREWVSRNSHAGASAQSRIPRAHCHSEPRQVSKLSERWSGRMVDKYQHTHIHTYTNKCTHMHPYTHRNDWQLPKLTASHCQHVKVDRRKPHHLKRLHQGLEARLRESLKHAESIPTPSFDTPTLCLHHSSGGD